MQFFSESKNRALILITFSALIFTLFTFSFVSIAELKIKAKSVNSVNQISFSGMAEVNAVPDIASFNIRVYETAPTTSEVEAKAANKTNKLMELLKENSVEKKDIQTADYRINPKYSYQNRPTYKQILEGYEASQTILVKIRDIKKAGEILSKISALEISEINGPFFEVGDIEKLKSQAQLEAIKNAKEKAQETAKNLGVNLGKIVRFYEEPVGNFRSPRPMMMAKMVSSESFDSAPPPPIESGEQKITSRVSITYEIQ